MLFSILISVTTVIGATIDNLMPAGSPYEDFFTSETSNQVAPDEESFLSSNSGDFTLDSSESLGFDDFPFNPSNDHVSSDLTDKLFDSNSLSSALDTSCNVEKRDQQHEFCSVESAPQVHLEFPDLLQMGNTVVKEDPFLAPITIEIGGDSAGKCINLLYPENFCCNGPLGLLAGGYSPLVVYETVDKCRPGMWWGLLPRIQHPPKRHRPIVFPPDEEPESRYKC